MTQPRRALITGGAKGIGLAIARRLAQEGATLALLGRDRDALQAAARELDATFSVADVTQPEALSGGNRRTRPMRHPGEQCRGRFLTAIPAEHAAGVWPP